MKVYDFRERKLLAEKQTKIWEEKKRFWAFLEYKKAFKCFSEGWKHWYIRAVEDIVDIIYPLSWYNLPVDNSC